MLSIYTISKKSFLLSSFSFFLSQIITIFVLGFFFFPSFVGAVSSRESYRNYKKLQKNIQRRYHRARRKRYSKPCQSYAQFKRYLIWLDRKKRKLFSLSLRSYHRRYTKRRLRQYRRYTRNQLRYTNRRCRRNWKKELIRIKARMNQKCRTLFGPSLQERSSALWLGISPWAHVYLNGHLCGTAPLFARLRPGTYRLRLFYPPGQDEYRKTVTLLPDSKPKLVVRAMKTPPPAPRKFTQLLAPKQLKWVLQRHKHLFKSCSIYAPTIKNMILSWIINPEGKSSDIRWENPSSVSSRFKRCIIRALSRITFPSRKGSARINAYSISL